MILDLPEDALDDHQQDALGQLYEHFIQPNRGNNGDAVSSEEDPGERIGRRRRRRRPGLAVPRNVWQLFMKKTTLSMAPELRKHLLLYGDDPSSFLGDGSFL